MLNRLFGRMWRGSQPDARQAQAWVERGLAAIHAGDAAVARAAFEAALSLDDGHLAAHVNLGHVLKDHANDFAGAAVHYRAALARDPGLNMVRDQLGLALYEQGDAPSALACFEEVLARDPEHRDAGQHALFTMNAVAGLDPSQVFYAHRRWAVLHADPLPRLPAAPERGRSTTGRLRVGIVSADLREHATLGFLEPLLEHLDRDRFEPYCYSSSPLRDAATGRIMAMSARWTDIHGMPDEQAAARIREDGVDLLLDLGGHTRDNRTTMLARKPARVQASWLGYLNTSGAAAIDYRITDCNADPVGLADAAHAERILRLPQSMWCYRPPSDVPAVAARPAGTPLTLGSFNHPAKLSDPALALWASLLKRIPASRMIIAGLAPGSGHDRVLGVMRKAGIDPSRLELLPRQPRAAYWKLLARTDVALDPFPYNGGATTCECLWMGVPVVSLAGQYGFARTGASLLHAAGCAEWLAADEDEYADRVVALASDPAGLAAVRLGLRERMRASVLLDAPAFARRFEQALVDAWEAHACSAG